MFCLNISIISVVRVYWFIGLVVSWPFWLSIFQLMYVFISSLFFVCLQCLDEVYFKKCTKYIGLTSETSIYFNNLLLLVNDFHSNFAS